MNGFIKNTFKPYILKHVMRSGLGTNVVMVKYNLKQNITLIKYDIMWLYEMEIPA